MLPKELESSCRKWLKWQVDKMDDASNMSDVIEAVRATAKTIGENVPYPLGMGFEGEILFLNQEG